MERLSCFSVFNFENHIIFSTLLCVYTQMIHGSGDIGNVYQQGYRNKLDGPKYASIWIHLKY